MSVPVVVVVHGNQGPNSEATIIWDNMFSKPVKEFMQVVEGISILIIKNECHQL